MRVGRGSVNAQDFAKAAESQRSNGYDAVLSWGQYDNKLFSMDDEKYADMDQARDQDRQTEWLSFSVDVLRREIRTKLMRPLRRWLTRAHNHRFLAELLFDGGGEGDPTRWGPPPPDQRSGGDDISTAEFAHHREKNYLLLWAAFAGNLRSVKQLWEAGAELDFRHPADNFDALHMAAFSGSLECVQWMLEQRRERASVVYTRVEQLSPLHFAALADSPPICELLLLGGNSDESTRYKCPFDNTVLHAVVQANALATMRYLLAPPRQRGAAAVVVLIDPNAYDCRGMTPLHVAADLGRERVMREFLQCPDVRVDAKRPSDLYTALHLAAENGHAQCVKMLLQAGANKDELTCRRQSPLYLACRLTFDECVDVLLHHRASVNMQDAENRTPLHAALTKSVKDVEKQTPLYEQTLTIVRKLVAAGADLNLPDKYGFTALHIAAHEELDECVEFLIISGANVAAKTKGKKTALEMINHKTRNSAAKIGDRLDLQIAYTDAQSLKFNFRDIIRNSNKGEIEYLYVLQKRGQSALLEHPLCQAFLHLKWQRIRKFIYLRALLSALTAALVSWYVLCIIPHPRCNVAPFNSSNSDAASPINKTAKGETPVVDEKPLLVVCWGAICLLLLVNMIRLFFTFTAYHSWRNFFKKWLNWFELTVITLTLSLYPYEPWLQLGYHKPVGSVTVLLSWTFVMFTLAELPLVGIYIAMFHKVLAEFLRMIASFIWPLVGFALAFHALDQEVFESADLSFVKVIAMMTGELGLSKFVKPATDNSSPSARFIGPVNELLALLFMLAITGVLMNLLVGIAVNDVDGLRKNADLTKLIRQTRLIYFVEKTCLSGPLAAVNAPLRRLLRRLILVWPDAYTVAMYVRPHNPKENRLPDAVMQTALRIGMDRRLRRLRENNGAIVKSAVESKLDALQERVGELTSAVNLIHELVRRQLLAPPVFVAGHDCLVSSQGAFADQPLEPDKWERESSADAVTTEQS